jgi:DNA replication protein DnaC
LSHIYDVHHLHPDVPCRCGRDHPWTWWEPTKPHHRRHSRARWTPPKVSPCTLCAPVEQLKERARLIHQAQSAASIPRALRPYSLDHVSIQPDDLDAGAWMQRVSRDPTRPVGLSRAQLATSARLSEWRPRKGAGSWLCLWGPVGSGKSLSAALLVRMLIEDSLRELDVAPIPTDQLERWLTPDQRARTPPSRLQAYQSGPRWPCWWVGPEQLCTAISDRWGSKYNRISNPLKRAAEVPLLVLDDVGVADRPDGRQGSPSVHEAKTMRQLTEARSSAELPTIITTNLPPERLLTEDGRECLYDARVGSRLAWMVGGNVVELAGHSWRQPPPPQEPPRQRQRR